MTQLPEAFVKSISGYPQLAVLQESLLESPVTSVRINTSKCRGIPSSLSSLATGTVPWCERGRYLSTRPQFTFDPCLHQGVYYVQDASSMAIAAAIEQISDGTPVAYLDTCAAPGGKTTCAVSYLPEGSLVVANEFDSRRASILYENLAKWGATDIVVSKGDTARLRKLGEIFDIVAVDAPCSGEGMMRKDIQAVEQWSPRLVESCASLQREIIANAVACLKSGGYIIYSTCTFNTSENEENVRWMMEEYGLVPVKIDRLEENADVVKGIGCDFPCYRFIPGRIDGEGLFLCVLRKPGNVTDSHIPASGTSKTNACMSECKKAKQWINGDMALWADGNEIWAATKKNTNMIRYISSGLNTLAHGVHVATVKGKDIIPCHELALSGIMEKNAFPNIEVSEDDAILFLQRENIILPDGTPKGFVVLTYGDIPLGFVKNIGNRSNNLLPKQWRILSRR